MFCDRKFRATVHFARRRNYRLRAFRWKDGDEFIESLFNWFPWYNEKYIHEFLALAVGASDRPSRRSQVSIELGVNGCGRVTRVPRGIIEAAGGKDDETERQGWRLGRSVREQKNRESSFITGLGGARRRSRMFFWIVDEAVLRKPAGRIVSASIGAFTETGRSSIARKHEFLTEEREQCVAEGRKTMLFK